MACANCAFCKVTNAVKVAMATFCASFERVDSFSVCASFERETEGQSRSRDDQFNATEFDAETMRVDDDDDDDITNCLPEDASDVTRAFEKKNATRAQKPAREDRFAPKQNRLAPFSHPFRRFPATSNGPRAKKTRFFERLIF